MPHVEVPQAEFKVVMLGDTFTGKTSLVLRFAEGYYRESGRGATVGAFFITKRLSVNGMTCKIQIWDTAGQEQFKKLAPMYYKNAAAAIVCYDITSPKSFDTLKFWMEELQRNVPHGAIVLAMCATKCDLAGRSSSCSASASTASSNNTGALADTRQAEELARATGAMFMKTSAKDDTNVTLLFEKVAEQVLLFQKRDSSLIPVTLASTSVETTANGIPNGSTTNPMSTNGEVGGGGYGMMHTPHSISSSMIPPLMDEVKVSSNSKHYNGSTTNGKSKTLSSLDDELILETAKSQDSQVEPNTRCDAHTMLMCGNPEEIMAEAKSQGCCIL